MRALSTLALVLLAAGPAASPVFAGSGQVTLIHTGDFHGHLIPRPNLRSDAQGNSVEGGLARVYTVIKNIRKEDPGAVLIHTGDTIQGSAEVLYTRGQAIVDILNTFRFDAFAPGNWEFVYGTQRFLELFADDQPKAPWHAIAANLHYATRAQDATSPYADKAGQRVLPPYVIRYVGGVKVGILGLTTDRGPQVVGSSVTKGFYFMKNGTEVDAVVAALVKELRELHKVDVLVMASEMGLANNVRLAEKIAGIDLVLSSDMHEETLEPVVTANGTLVVEEGQDGTRVGQITLTVKDGKVAKWAWKGHDITDKIKADDKVAALVKKARASFVAGKQFAAHTNPFNGAKLKRPIDTVVGHTKVGLHRSNFAREAMPAAIEGSAHDFLTDAFKAQTGADIGAIRGFRYGTHVRPGPILMEDLYHFMPIGAQIAKGSIKGQALKMQIEGAANGSLAPDVASWTGGWLFNFSGVTMDLDPYQGPGQRASNIKVGGLALDPTKDYSYASYWYSADPGLINVLPAANIVVLKDSDGGALDGAEVVVRYLESLPDKTADVQLNRISLKSKATGEPIQMPPYRFGFPEVQPLRGAKP
jgi:2',3'-cyclic-nucleotide 2'-phosphodiesterase (5'-nucleotidase family)